MSQAIPVFLLKINEDLARVSYVQNDESVIYVLTFAAGRGEFDTKASSFPK